MLHFLHWCYTWTALLSANQNRTKSESNKIGRPRSGIPICLSRVWLQTELDDTKSYYQLIRKITISEKKKNSPAKLWKKRKIYIKIQTKEALKCIWQIFFLFARLNLPNMLISVAIFFFDSDFPSPCFDVPKASNFTSGGVQSRQTKTQETSNDCDVISGLQASRKTEISVIFLLWAN